MVSRVIIVMTIILIMVRVVVTVTVIVIMPALFVLARRIPFLGLKLRRPGD